MRNYFLHIIIFISFPVWLSAQTMEEGEVSFITSSNIYLKFVRTEAIVAGDTLYANKDKTDPILIVTGKSSNSVVGKKLINIELSKGKKLYFIKTPPIEVTTPTVEAIKKEGGELPPVIITEDQNNGQVENKSLKQKGYNGRINFSTNTLAYSGAEETNNRIRASVIMNTFNNNSFVSATQSYFAYRKNLNATATTLFDDLKIYNLALQMKLGKNDALWVGRKINTAIANVGAIDGVQYDHQFGKGIASGVFMGSRPDYLDYGINLDLKQYGGYISHTLASKTNYSQTSLAGVNQMNGGKTDRKFLYFQHTSTLFKNLNVFGSVEMDLFQNYNDRPVSDFRLTSMYATLRYRVSKKLSLTTSYDNRRNIVYFESNKIYIDSLIDNETRQGLRLQCSFSPLRNVTIMASKFYRYQEDKPTTDNTNVNLNINRIAIIDANLSLNATTFNSGYIKSKIYGGRINKYMLKSKLQVELSYRQIQYTYPGNDFSINQKAYGINLSYQILRMTMINVNYEATVESSQNYKRYFITLSRRFKG